MSNDPSPAAFRKTPDGEFTWPPSREELDAIEVIPLGNAPLAQPRARLRRPPRRDNFVFAGVLATSMLAIGVAASMQFSDLWSPAPEPAIVAAAPPEQPLTPLFAQTMPVMASLATAPVASFASPEPTPAPRRVADVRRSRAPRSYAARRSPQPWRAEPANYTRPRLISPESGRHGKVVLLVQVRKNGKVGDVDVLSSDLDRKNRSHRDLQRAAVSAVKKWRYEPALRNGRPADTQMRVVVDINLDSSRVAFTGANARRRAAAANRAADTVLAAR